MQIDGYQIEPHERGCIVSARVGSMRIHYQLIGQNTAPLLGDPFVQVGLIPAMEAREPLVISPNIPVSQRLLENLVRYQEIYSRWWPHVQPIEIDAPTRVAAREPTGKVGCFCSGGVDSFYSAIRRRDEITHFVLCRGLDIPMAEVERWQHTVTDVERFARVLNKPVLLVETNAKQLRSQRTDNHGAILVSTASLLGLDSIIVPSSHANPTEVFAWGSHPLTDPLLSSDWTAVIHDDVATRTDKTKLIVETGIGLDQLRVCNRFSEYNCGHCEKCLRTMTALELLGSKSASLPAFELGALRGITLWEESPLTFWIDNLQLAQQVGRADVEREVRRIVNSYRRRHFLKDLDQRFLKGALTQLYRRLTGKS